MKTKNIKKRIEIISEKIERIEELEEFISTTADPEHQYYKIFGSESERSRDIRAYQLEVEQLENAIDLEIEMLNELK